MTSTLTQVVRQSKVMVLAATAGAAISLQSKGGEFMAVEHQRQTIYHSPQKPGFTSWCGAWTMPEWVRPGMQFEISDPTRDEPAAQYTVPA